MILKYKVQVSIPSDLVSAANLGREMREWLAANVPSSQVGYDESEAMSSKKITLSFDDVEQAVIFKIRFG